MTKVINSKLNTVLMSVLAFFAGAVLWAQENNPGIDLNVDVTETRTTEEWFTNPLYWIIGALVLVVLIALVARGGRR
ncbi:MAG: hypothetical protein Q4F57_05840 [Weeksellaceae bacterium]|nr:hypothetical protein [Weeksellaceae bacterium]